MIIVTRYRQKVNNLKVCKRHTFKRNKLISSDSYPIPEESIKELMKDEKTIYFIDVEKKTDLDLK